MGARLIAHCRPTGRAPGREDLLRNASLLRISDRGADGAQVYYEEAFEERIHDALNLVSRIA